MAIFVLRRLTAALITLLLASFVIFAIVRILPGDPAEIILGINASDDTLAALRDQMGLNQPLHVQYWAWIKDIFSGTFGLSYTYSVPVSELVGDRMWVSIPLALLSLTLSTVIAIPVGVWAASHHGKKADLAVMGATQLGIAIPNFWFAMLLVITFAVTLRWLPSGGFPGWEAGLMPALRSLLLPSIALALPQASIMARIMRSSMLEVVHEDYMRTARAKGMPRSRVLWRHGVRNALIPVLTILGLQFSFLIAGTIIVENIFFLPGLGRMIFQSIAQRDLIVVQSVVLMLVGMIIMINFLVDIAYSIADPRIRIG